MSDAWEIAERLREGIIEHPKRWSGDTHDDLGGSANFEATYAVMSEAAATILSAQARIAELEAALSKANDLIDIVEGARGAFRHGTWRDDDGDRLKDTPEWVVFYLAARRALEAKP